MNKKKKWRHFLLFIMIFGILAVLSVFAIRAYMLFAANDVITSAENAADFGADCILVLGAGVRDDGTPSDMLADRLKTGLALYKNDAAPKLLMSGDHGQTEYNEVGVMKAYALEAGVPSEDVFMDHAGFSTYESLYRARDVFKAKRVIIVTQEYHLPRALHIAHSLGLEAVGVPADLHVYYGQAMHDLRETAAQTKDFLKCLFKPKPTYLGDAIPVSGDGNLTND